VGQAVEVFQHSLATFGQPRVAQTHRPGGMGRQRGLVCQE
jgi:hypothetical protein